MTPTFSVQKIKPMRRKIKTKSDYSSSKNFELLFLFVLKLGDLTQYFMRSNFKVFS